MSNVRISRLLNVGLVALVLGLTFKLWQLRKEHAARPAGKHFAPAEAGRSTADNSPPDSGQAPAPRKAAALQAPADEAIVLNISDFELADSVYEMIEPQRLLPHKSNGHHHHF